MLYVKAIYPSLLLSLKKILGQVGFFNITKTTLREKFNAEFKICYLRHLWYPISSFILLISRSKSHHHYYKQI